MNNFSFNRLGMYAKSEIMSNRKKLLLFVGCAIGVFMVAHYFNYIGRGAVTNFEGAKIFSWIFIGVSSMGYASGAFKKYFSKGYASAALMLPVSKSEKFTYAALMNMVAVPLVLALIGYSIHTLWALVCGFENSFIDIDGALQTPVMIVVSAMLSMAYFFLGAVFFRRNQFALTLLAMACISTVLVYTLYIMNELGVDFKSFGMWINNLLNGYPEESAQQFLEYAAIVWNSICLVVVMFFSWRCFRKLQITK